MADTLPDKNYVVYILPNDANCTNLSSKLKAEYEHVHNKTHFQDVRLLSSRPPWLKFVPTFVDKSSKKMYTGDEIIAFVKTLPPEFTFSFLGGSRLNLFSLSDGQAYESFDVNKLDKNSFSLQDESAAPKPSRQDSGAFDNSGTPTLGTTRTRSAEQQHREAENQRRLDELIEARSATMSGRRPGPPGPPGPLGSGFSNGGAPQAYPPQQSPYQGYPPQQSPYQAYPPQQNYPPQQSPYQAYPPQQNYPPQQSPYQAYPPQQNYPPQQSPYQAYPPQQTYPPQQSQYQQRYTPQQPQQGGFHGYPSMPIGHTR